MRRIKRAKGMETLYQQLGAGRDSVFESMKDVFLFAAALGFARGEREPVEAGGEVFGPTVFSEDDVALMRLMAIAEVEDVGILHPDREEELISIVEEYANAGISHLAKVVLDSPGDPLDNLITLVAKEARDYPQGRDLAHQVSERFRD